MRSPSPRAALGGLALILLGSAGCSTHRADAPRDGEATPPREAVPAPTPTPVPTAELVQPTASPAAANATPTSALGYPWMSGAPLDRLSDRFAPPPGFTRVTVPASSFGAWLRGLPLEPEGTPVKSYRGAVVLPADHENLAAVVAIDVGDADLQQCADSVYRLHAEWLFARGRRDASYRAASGEALPFARWARGDRVTLHGTRELTWATSAKPDASHASYRRWLDVVFAWANTGSLARDTERVDPAQLVPGDFVVQPGGPGHAVLVLDEATAPDGRRALLLGQGFMPAQSFQVLRPSRGSPSAPDRGAWFIVSPGSVALDTPFWPAFPWSALHRFPAR